MKKSIFILIALVSLSACKSKKVLEIQDRLPKDIALMPERDYSSKSEEERRKDEENMQKLRASIDELISSVNCTNPDDWRISPLGSKACGGPASFIAYPIKLEEDILPQITEYNRQSSAYNLKYGIVSDCAVTPAPAGIRCENGKPVLISASVDSNDSN